MWAFATDPLTKTNDFCNACCEVGEATADFFATLDKDKLTKCTEEIQRLYGAFDGLSDSEKGHLIGYCIGKFGVDFFAGSATIKSIVALKKLREANRLCNLEAMVLSTANKETLSVSATKHALTRENFFKNLKVHWDRQNKHIPGSHNYGVGKSIFEHPNAQELIDKFAGKGIPRGNRVPGLPDYREALNFGEHIGYHVNKDTGVMTATTWGEIRYAKNGVHIIPILPLK